MLLKNTSKRKDKCNMIITGMQQIVDKIEYSFIMKKFFYTRDISNLNEPSKRYTSIWKIIANVLIKCEKEKFLWNYSHHDYSKFYFHNSYGKEKE